MALPCNLRPHTEIEGVSVARRVGGKKEISRRGEKEGEEATPPPLRRDYDGVKRSRNGGGGGFGSFLSSAAARGMGIWGKISGSERERERPCFRSPFFIPPTSELLLTQGRIEERHFIFVIQ